MDATQGWIPTTDDDVTDAPYGIPNPYGIFAFGNAGGSATNVSNLVSNTGVVATDTTGVGTARDTTSGCEYSYTKGIFAFGYTEGAASPSYVGMSNLVSNTGVVATDVAAVGTASNKKMSATYGGTKGIFGFGYTSVGSAGNISTTNLVSTSGVIGSDVSGAGGTARRHGTGTEYGADKDKAIFYSGYISAHSNTSNLVSNVGVVASDTTGVGTGRVGAGGCWYGDDKGIFGFGHDGTSYMGVTNLISNLGVIATDTSAVGTARTYVGACEYGHDKGIFGYGNTGSATAVTNLVSNAGVVASDVTGVGTARINLGACSFG
jgi:hypothetical protein